jgi:hypothetical protein
VCLECRPKLRKQKEWEVLNYLRENVSQKPAFHDSSRPVSECSKRRPDIFYQCLGHCVIVEVDENQHRNYNPSCECARISEIVGSLGGFPVVFIRYNPDAIKWKGKFVSGVSREKRLEMLVDVVKKELNAIFETFTVRLIQLFYDDDGEDGEYDSDYQPLKVEDITRFVTV